MSFIDFHSKFTDILFLLIILKMLSQIWQETHDKYEMQLSEQTRDMLKQQYRKHKEVKNKERTALFVDFNTPK